MTAHKMYNKCLRFCFVSAFFCLHHGWCCSLFCFFFLRSLSYVLLIAAMNFSRPLIAYSHTVGGIVCWLKHVNFWGQYNVRNDTFMMCTVALTSFYFSLFFCTVVSCRFFSSFSFFCLLTLSLSKGAIVFDAFFCVRYFCSFHFLSLCVCLCRFRLF